MPTTVLKHSSNSCNFFVVSRYKLVVKFASQLPADGIHESLLNKSYFDILSLTYRHIHMTFIILLITDSNCITHVEAISHKLLGRRGRNSCLDKWRCFACIELKMTIKP